jgi:hypothetical protein
MKKAGNMQQGYQKSYQRDNKGEEYTQHSRRLFLLKEEAVREMVSVYKEIVAG